jgi:hypothetical protein
MPYDEYLLTPEWRDRRLAALARAGYRCQLCYSAGPLDVHHRTYERRGEELDSDLIALCRDCHRDHHGRLNVRALNRARIQAAFEPGAVASHPYRRGLSEEEDCAYCATEVFDDLCLACGRLAPKASLGFAHRLSSKRRPAGV